MSLILLNVHRDLPVLGISIHGYSVLVSHGGRGGDIHMNNDVDDDGMDDRFQLTYNLVHIPFMNTLTTIMYGQVISFKHIVVGYYII